MNRAGVRGPILKEILELLFHAPDKFDQSLLCQPETLRRLLGKHYESIVGEAISSRDLAIEGLKRLALRLYWDAIQQDDPHLAEGVILIWHQYLAPIRSGSARAIPAVARVLVHCAQNGNLRMFLQEAKKFASDSGLTPQAQDAQNGLLFLDMTTVSRGSDLSAQLALAQSQRRTYTNYIRRAFDELARTNELATLFETEHSPASMGTAFPNHNASIVEGKPVTVTHELTRPPALEALVARLIKECSYLPSACGHTIPVSCAAERTIDMRHINGRPVLLHSSSIEKKTLRQMSGLLVGVPGSGRTAFLRQVTYAWAKTWSYGQPFGVYVSALDFLIYARNRRSVYECIAEQTLPRASHDDVQFLCKELEEYEQAHGLLLLIDDLDRLSEMEQCEIVTQLAFSPAVLYATVPWTVDQIARQMRQSHVGAFSLVDLSVEQQQEMLTRLITEREESRVSARVCLSALQRTPSLAKLPLGVVAIFSRLLAGEYRGARFVECALGEWFRRAGLPHPQFMGEWLALDPIVRSLIVMATVTAADMVWTGEPDIFTTRERYKQGAGWTEECRWELLPKSRLFEPHPHRDDALRFVNADILCFLIAQTEVAGLFVNRDVQLSVAATPLMEMAYQIKRYMGK